jgi:hypothetical protein
MNEAGVMAQNLFYRSKEPEAFEQAFVLQHLKDQHAQLILAEVIVVKAVDVVQLFDLCHGISFFCFIRASG